MSALVWRGTLSKATGFWIVVLAIPVWLMFRLGALGFLFLVGTLKIVAFLYTLLSAPPPVDVDGGRARLDHHRVMRGR